MFLRLFEQILGREQFSRPLIVPDHGTKRTWKSF